MKFNFIKLFVISVVILGPTNGPLSAYAASANPTLAKAKQEAEAKGFIFATMREPISTRPDCHARF